VRHRLYGPIAAVATLLAFGVPALRGLDPGAERAIGLLLVLLGATVVAFVARWPLAVLAVTVGLQVAAVSVNLPPWGILVVGAALASVVAAERVVVATVASAAAASVLLVAEQLSAMRYAVPPSFVQLTLVLALGVTAGLALRQDARSRAAVAARLEATRQQAVAEERLRLARELHDSVAHHMAAINIQSAAAGRLLDSAPDAARQALLNVGNSARIALGELQEVVGTLRAGDEPESWVGSATNLADLVQRNRDDLTVTVVDDGAMETVPQEVRLTALRMIAEALTNASKYAHGAAVGVVVRREAEGLLLEIRNGAGQRVVDSDGGGHGLVGMRERAAGLGGWCDPRETADGFEVRAWLPTHGGES
jgi:signal transduction histidine kinase